MPNAVLAYAVQDHIEANPKSWDQERWSCDTKACFAGWTTVIGLPNSKVEFRSIPDYAHEDRVKIDGTWKYVKNTAANLLDISDNEACRLFYGRNNFDDLTRLVRDIFGERPVITEPIDEMDLNTVVAALFDQVAVHQVAIDEIKQQLTQLKINQER